MALFNWFGGTGRFGAGRNWDPRGVPGAGDTARVGAGDAVVQRGSVGATVVIGGTDAGSAPVLDLRSASVAAVTMPSDLPTSATDVTPPEYGTVEARGLSRIGSLEVGNFANYLPGVAPGFPQGHGVLTVPDNLRVNLVGRAQLDTSFDVKDGSTLTVTGGAGSSLNAAESVIEGGTVTVNAPLEGQGTVTVSGGGIPNEDFEPKTGTLELGGPVGAGETIDINLGRVLIDQPLQFAGTLNVRASEGGGIGAQDVMLRGLAADSYSFDDAAHTLTLWDGNAALDTIQFSAGATSGTFQPVPTPGGGLPYGHLAVRQTTEGVQLQGPFDNTPAGSTLIPLHAPAG